MNRIVIALSGGLDSTAAATIASQRCDMEVVACSFDYGQRHQRETVAAAAVAAHLGIEHSILDLRGLLSGSALLGEGAIPEGHYAATAMAQTVVPGRNLLFLSALVPLAGAGGQVWFGAHRGDRAIYPDCRPEFWDGARQAADAYGVGVVTPFWNTTKRWIVFEGAAIGAPFGLSWSCYAGGDVHCGRCGTCVERAEAFALADVADPTTYEDADFWRAVTA